MKKLLYSVVLLAAVVFAVLGPIFFGHALVTKETKWFGIAAVCLLIGAVLMFVVKAIAPDDLPVPHHH